MYLPKAIQRLTWRFSSGKSFKANQNDINALNAVLTYVNDEQVKKVQNNRLFAKLYIYQLNKYINDFGNTMFSSIPEKELSRLLNIPLESFFKAFHASLHENIRIKVFEENGIELTVPALKDKVQLNNEKLNLSRMSKDDIKKVFQETYSLEIVTDELIKMCNEALKRFS